MVTARELRSLGALSDVDVELAETLARISGERDERVRLGAAFASAAVQNGHTCAELERIALRPLHDASGETLSNVELPPLGDWVEALRKSPLVADGELSPSAPRPLVLAEGSRLYLARYFEYERRLAEALRARVGPDDAGISGPRLQNGLERLFPKESPGSAEQRTAALLAVLSRLSVISGGPGTGKTFTVAKILVLLQEQALAAGHEFYRIALLAPTGKAAQRLGEAIRKNLETLPAEQNVLDSVSREPPSTLHRALGYQARTPTRFRHRRDQPLPRDIVVVDEASMVDLAMMAKLVDAVSDDARLILLGDRNQLASVEAGSILADMYAGRDRGFSALCAERIERLTGDVLPRGASAPSLADGMLELTHSHRFREGSGIAELARAVNTGDATAALAVLGSSPTVTLEPLPERDHLERALGSLVEQKLARLGGSPVPEKLALLDGFRILCSHRRGPFGVEALNVWVTAQLRKLGALEGDGEFYDGRPIIVTANDYDVDLFNGDVGVIARSEPGLFAHFPPLDRGPPRRIPLGLVPPHETAFAMSVHKAQGSEFDEIALLLGDRPSPILTRELVYTAVTRARTRVRIFGSPEVLSSAIAARVQRASGLRERLWGSE